MCPTSHNQMVWHKWLSPRLVVVVVPQWAGYKRSITIAEDIASYCSFSFTSRNPHTFDCRKSFGMVDHDGLSMCECFFRDHSVHPTFHPFESTLNTVKTVP
jgi:hypothetical protein